MMTSSYIAFGFRLLRQGLLLGLMLLLFGGSPGVMEALAQDRSDIPAFLLDPTYRSTRTNEKKATHDGNEIAITFFNTGLLAGVGEVRGNWPKGSESFYVGDVVPVVAAEVPIDLDGDGTVDTFIVHSVTPRHPRAGSNVDPNNRSIFWGFEPTGGFASEEDDNASPAVSNDPTTWPNFWPDQPNWIDGEGNAEWNGFFGRGVFNADQESYFWMDDQNDLEVQTEFPGFQPDSTDPTRGGLGLAVKARGLQWSQFLAQDVLFFVYEVVNTSTTTYPRVAVGLTVGTLAGGDGDSQDDLAFFDQLNRIVYSYDFPPFVGAQGQNVGIAGYAFMESPGNALDGIDNDGDGDPLEEPGLDLDGRPFVPLGLQGEGNIFTPSDFQARLLQAGDPLVLIDGDTFERTFAYVPASGSITVVSQGVSYTVQAGDQLEETQTTIRSQIGEQVVTEKNLIDEDLDGLIDEDETLHFLRRKQNFNQEIEELPPVRYKNWVGLGADSRNGAASRQDSIRHGFFNQMIDEAGDDGIDNDGDWDRLTDDVGGDGRSGTGDNGEGDGLPTPGEPNFDNLDVNETDQVGLTSFFYFTPPGAIRMNDDDRLWEALTPGFFTTNEELSQQQNQGGVDGDFIFGSGYFRLEPGQSLRFSMAMVFGNGEDFAQKLATITNNTVTVQEIYDRNYNFARPPDKPTLRGVPGDGKVTLFWDAVAEASVDPILGMDFQGYRIYKSTDPFFRDPEVITDGFGNDALIAPIAQFDLNDGVNNFWTGNQDIINRTRATPFYLGDDTGIKHSFVDTEVDNGRTYYYAVTAYDGGSAEFYPAENNRAVTIREDGSVVTDKNVVRVVPNDAVLGYSAGGLEGEVTHTAGPATGEVFVEVLDPGFLQDNTDYEITFQGTGFVADSFSVTANGVTLVDQAPLADSESQIFDGLRALFNNDPIQLDLDATSWADPAGMVDVFVAVTNVPEWRYTGQLVPNDYEIRFSDQASGTSIGGFRLGTRGPNAVAAPTFFEVINATENRPAEFVFFEVNPDGRFNSLTDFIFIYETLNGVRTPTFAIRADGAEGNYPSGGDVYRIAALKPYRAGDVFRFSTRASDVDDATANEQLDRIRVVPNPYVAAASWEARLPPTVQSGRGERRIDFTHVPRDAVIRIYSVRGELVRTLRHDGNIADGTVRWDLKTRTGLDVAYGVYFYHVEAPNVGSTTGKIAIIK